ncbi:hypothetical protein BG000_003931, partial [Podila horticola]
MASDARDKKVEERIRHRLKRQATASRGDLPHPSRWMYKHLKTLDISVEPPAGTYCNPNPLELKKFQAFLGSVSGNGIGDVPWPALELFQITLGKGWTIVDHPRATE